MTLNLDSVQAEEKHLPRLAQLCDNLGAVLAGQAAQRILDAQETTDGCIIILPSWAWIIPVIDVGKKGRSQDGVRQTMPSRLTWTPSPVLSAPYGDVEVSWRLSGLGHNRSGTATIPVGGALSQAPTTEVRLDDQIAVAASIRHTILDSQRVRTLRGLVKDGVTARWELMSGFEQFTRAKVQSANNTVAAEIAQHKGIPLAGVIDDITVDDLVAKLMYGHGGTSTIQRMIDSALAPDRFNSVDPMHFFTVGIRARAEEAVRRHIGDPKVGPKVRRVFAKAKVSTLPELIEAYRQLYPNDSLGKNRALAALSAGADIATTQRMLREEITAASDGEDQ